MSEWLLLLFGLILLLDGAKLFVRASVNITEFFGLSVGITSVILAIGTSLPELFVTISSTLSHDESLGYGTIIGSNISNVLVIFGALIAYKALKIHSRNLVMGAQHAVLLSALFGAMALAGYRHWYSLVLLALAGVIIYDRVANPASLEFIVGKKSQYKLSFLIIMGSLSLVAVLFGAQVIAQSAHSIAQNFGVSEFYLGLILVALGTSLPELATSFAALSEKKHELAIANIVTSNILNISLVGGIGLLSVGFFSTQNYVSIIMLVLTALLLWLILYLMRNRQLPRATGVIMIAGYFIYLVIVISRSLT